MLKIKKLLLIINLIAFILFANTVYSADIGIVVELADGSIETDCVNVPSETDGFAILEKSVFDVLWSPTSVFGQSLCKISGEGTEIEANFCKFFPEQKFWNFNILPNGDSEWIHSPVGHNGPGGCWNRDEFSFAGRYCGIDKDVIGYKFGPGADEPPLKTYEQVCEKLKVKDIRAYVDGKKESGADEDGGKIDVVPGSKLELQIEIENLYTDDEDVEIEEISVEGTLEGIDDGGDIDDSANDFDLNAEKDNEITLEFNIPLEVKEGDYDLVVEIEGENERGFPYSKIIEFEVEVEKEKHDVIFNEMGFSDGNIECGRAAELNVDIVNLGTNEEDVNLIITNQDLGINMQESFKLNEDPFDKKNSFRRSYAIELPQNTVPGRYLFLADLSFGNDVERSSVELNVECDNFVSAEETEKTINGVTGLVSKPILQPKTKELSQEKSIQQEESFFNESSIVTGLVIFTAITFIAIIILLIALLKI